MYKYIYIYIYVYPYIQREREIHILVDDIIFLYKLLGWSKNHVNNLHITISRETNSSLKQTSVVIV